MKKIWLIIQREYLSRVKKKSFILMTILGPILMAAILVIPIYLSLREKSVQKIQVVDDSGIFHENPIRSTADIKVELGNFPLRQAKDSLYKTDYTAIVWIPENIVTGGGSITFFYKKPPGLHVQTYIKTEVEQTIIDLKLIDNNIDKNVLANAQKTSRVKVITTQQTESGDDKETDTGINMAVGFGSAILIYGFIFLYGVQVMRGVIEEKSSRIIEVIISSVKPFQLMMGKIIGIALVGLTQFMLWILLTTLFFSLASATILKDVAKDFKKKELQTEQVMKKGADLHAMEEMKTSPIGSPNEALKLWDDFQKINYVHIFACFIFYFLGGYLLYSALFAAVGAAVDNEADTQQFMIPLTVPLIFAFVISQVVVQDPESKMAFWFSMIPFTSPVVMMVRLPFGGVPEWQIILSMGLLILGFLFTTWLAGKIYRTGILMYGKKITYRELGKWLFYRG
jgi:ABC-2 type transport system permease protein